jgi:hypothetical protein
MWLAREGSLAGLFYSGVVSLIEGDWLHKMFILQGGMLNESINRQS